MTVQQDPGSCEHFIRYAATSKERDSGDAGVSATEYAILVALAAAVVVRRDGSLVGLPFPRVLIESYFVKPLGNPVTAAP